MNEHEVDEALARVRAMQSLVLDHQGFAGFSGLARMGGGAAALLTALILSRAVPDVPLYHLIGWGALLAVGVAVNFAALVCWLYKNRRALSPAELWPVLEVAPALAVGAALSYAVIRADHLDLLFGVWMSLYGVSHLAYRRNLPLGVYCGGLAYVAAGIFCLMWPGIRFTDPRPMGLAFGLGELFGGWMLAKGRV
jgi:hypothetical protein